MFRALPERLTPVVKPLMDSIRKEPDEQLQIITAKRLAELVEQCRSRTPCPNDKVLCNLCSFLRSDHEFTPPIYKNSTPQQYGQTPSQNLLNGTIVYNVNGSNNGKPLSATSSNSTAAYQPVLLSATSNVMGNYNGIVTLNNQQKNAERAVFKRSNSAGRGPGRPPTTDIPLDELFKEEDETQKAGRVQRRGATYALTEIVNYYGATLPQKLPKLWELMMGQLSNIIDPDNFRRDEYVGKDSDAESVVWALQVLEVTSPSVHPNLRPILMESMLTRLCILLSHPYRAVRHLASRCLAVFAKLDSVPIMELVVSKVQSTEKSVLKLK